MKKQVKSQTPGISDSSSESRKIDPPPMSAGSNLVLIA
jgi:hypothetical protein